MNELSFKKFLAQHAEKAELAPNEKEIRVPGDKVEETITMLKKEGYIVLGTSLPNDEVTIWFYKDEWEQL